MNGMNQAGASLCRKKPDKDRLRLLDMRDAAEKARYSIRHRARARRYR